MSNPATPPRPPCGRPITVKLYGETVQIGTCNQPMHHFGGCSETDWEGERRP